MFDKFLGKFKKSHFDLPDKNFVYDSRTVSKLSSKDLILLTTDQDKYITTLLKKFDGVKEDYDRQVEKIEELTEKNEVINREMRRINNEHEELSIKFNNIQNSLEMTLREKETVQKGKETDKDKDRLRIETKVSTAINNQLLQLRMQVDENQGLDERFRLLVDSLKREIVLVGKIEAQNGKLKQRIEELETRYYSVEESDKVIRETVITMTHDLHAKDTQLKNLKEKLHVQSSHEAKLAETETLYLHAKTSLSQLLLSHEALMASELQGQQKVADMFTELLKKNREAEESAKELSNLKEFMSQNKEQASVEQFESRQLKEKLEEAQKHFDEDLIQWKDKDQISSKKVQYLNDMLRHKDAEIRELSKITRENLDALEAQLTHANATEAKLNQRIIHLQDEAHKLKIQSSTFQELRQTNLSLAEQLQAVKDILALAEEKKGESKETSEETLKLVAEKQKQLEECEMRYAQFRAESLKSVQESQHLLSKKTSEIEDLGRKLRKMQSQQNTTNIKSQNIRKTVDKLNDKIRESKQSMQKVYQDNLIHLDKISQLEDKVKEYKREIHRQKSQKSEMEENHAIKLRQLESSLADSSKEMEITKKESNVEHQAKETEMGKKIKRLEEDVQDSTQENERLQRELAEARDLNLKSEQAIKQLSDRREHAIIQIQKLQRIVEQKNSSRSTAPSLPLPLPTPTPIQPPKQDRSKKMADKAFRAFSIMLKMLQGMYKQFVNDYIGEIKEERVKKLESTINQLITKATDMKDVFKDYM